MIRRILMFIDSIFNIYYKTKSKYFNFIHPKIFYQDYKKGTIRTTFFNGKRTIYPEPITINELKTKMKNERKN
jgi:hypothetical protein